MRTTRLSYYLMAALAALAAALAAGGPRWTPRQTPGDTIVSRFGRTRECPWNEKSENDEWCNHTKLGPFCRLLWTNAIAISFPEESSEAQVRPSLRGVDR